MSIRKMIAEHPSVAGHVNEPLAAAARHAMYCAVICTSCADACSAEAMDMRRCIRLCMDCADVCTATMKLATRQTDDNHALVISMLQLCIQACETCAVECEQHDHAHCKRCGEMCRELAADCAEALASLG